MKRNCIRIFRIAFAAAFFLVNHNYLIGEPGIAKPIEPSEAAAIVKLQLESIQSLQGVVEETSASRGFADETTASNGLSLISRIRFSVDFKSGLRYADGLYFSDIQESGGYYHMVSATDNSLFKAYQKEKKTSKMRVGKIAYYEGQPVAEAASMFNYSSLKAGFLRDDIWKYIQNAILLEQDGIPHDEYQVYSNFIAPINHSTNPNATATFLFKAWLSEENGYLPKRIEVWRTIPAELLQSEFEVTDFYEYSPGMWIPLRVKTSSYSVHRELPEGITGSQILEMSPEEYDKIRDKIKYHSKRIGYESYGASLDSGELRVNTPVDITKFLNFFPSDVKVTDFTKPEILAPRELAGSEKPVDITNRQEPTNSYNLRSLLLIVNFFVVILLLVFFYSRRKNTTE